MQSNTVMQSNTNTQYNTDNSYFIHLKEKNMTYFAHLKQAWTVSIKMAVGSIVCFIHGLYPDLFQTTGTSIAKDIASYSKKSE